MANVVTPIDEWSVKDLEDNSSLKVLVQGCSELGNDAKPGIQVMFLGYTINFEPNRVEQWAYKAGKEGLTDYVLSDSWMVHTDQYIKVSLLIGSPLKAKVEVKTRSSKPVVKEYPLPFQV
jgi:hypothetical protein